MTYQIGEVEQIITPDGEVYNLEDGAMRALTDIGGRGMPGVEYVQNDGYQQPYPVVTGWKLEPRSVLLQLTMYNTTRQEYWEHREELIAALRFNRGGPFTLRHVRADGTRRDLQCLPAASPEFPSDVASWDNFQVAIELVAFNPLFFDADSTVETAAFSPIDELVFPITFPIMFQPGTYQQTLNIQYDGSFATYPMLEISGPYETLTLTHIQTGAVLSLGVAIGASDKRYIDLTPRQQAITDQHDDDKFGELVLPDSNLIAFNLRPKGTGWRNSPFEGVADGLNQIWIQATGITATTSLSFIYKAQYIDLA